MLTATLVLLTSALAEAHYTFPNLFSTSDWQYVRETANHYSNAPVPNVTDPAILCYQLASGDEGAATYSIAAGSTLVFNSAIEVYHPGPMFAYMAKAPSGYTADTWDGSGTYWFKIFEDEPYWGSYEMMWPNMDHTAFNFTIPSCLCGQYLFRIEQIGLHVATTLNGAQPYLACAQLDVTNSDCNDQSPAAGSDYLVSFPGAYAADDPGLLIDIYENNVATYVTPGPAVWSCGD